MEWKRNETKGKERKGRGVYRRMVCMLVFMLVFMLLSMLVCMRLRLLLVAGLPSRFSTIQNTVLLGCTIDISRLIYIYIAKRIIHTYYYNRLYYQCTFTIHLRTFSSSFFIILIIIQCLKMSMCLKIKQMSFISRI